MTAHLVPFSSQYADLGHHEWRARGCGIASLHMVMGYWHARDADNRLPAVDELLEKGRSIGAYREGVGWTHRGLLELARAYGYDGFTADHAPQGNTPKSPEAAWQNLTDDLSRGPVMASVYAGFDPARGGGHIVVVTDVSDGLVFFNDPEAMNAWEGRRMLASEVFRRAYKLRYVIIRPG